MHRNGSAGISLSLSLRCLCHCDWRQMFCRCGTLAGVLGIFHMCVRIPATSLHSSRLWVRSCTALLPTESCSRAAQASPGRAGHGAQRPLPCIAEASAGGCQAAPARAGGHPAKCRRSMTKLRLEPRGSSDGPTSLCPPLAHTGREGCRGLTTLALTSTTSSLGAQWC